MLLQRSVPALLRSLSSGYDMCGGFMPVICTIDHNTDVRHKIVTHSIMVITDKNLGTVITMWKHNNPYVKWRNGYRKMRNKRKNKVFGSKKGRDDWD